MIVPKQPQIKRMLQYVGAPLLYFLCWDLLIVFAYQYLGWTWIGSKSVPLALYGSIIGLIIGFRNNYAYARWWEARTLWGQVVNNSRSLARQVCAIFVPSAGQRPEEAAAMFAMRDDIVRHQIAFAHALRQQLRELDALSEVRHLVSAEEFEALANEKNIPVTLQLRMGSLLREARRAGWIDNWEWQSLDRNLDDLADCQGGTERIKNTPLPKQYSFFPTLFVRIYATLLPIGMVETLGWYTPLGSTVVGFMFLALDKIGRDLENPFDNKIFDVPLRAITKTIEINLLQMIGVKEVPAPEVPIKGVLW